MVANPTHLWNIDPAPEQFQVFPQPLRFVSGVEDGQLGEHPHVGPLQPQARLQQGHQLVKVA